MTTLLVDNIVNLLHRSTALFKGLADGTSSLEGLIPNAQSSYCTNSVPVHSLYKILLLLTRNASVYFFLLKIKNKNPLTRPKKVNSDRHACPRLLEVVSHRPETTTSRDLDDPVAL